MQILLNGFSVLNSKKSETAFVPLGYSGRPSLASGSLVRGSWGGSRRYSRYPLGQVEYK